MRKTNQERSSRGTKPCQKAWIFLGEKIRSFSFISTKTQKRKTKNGLEGLRREKERLTNRGGNVSVKDVSPLEVLETVSCNPQRAST